MKVDTTYEIDYELTDEAENCFDKVAEVLEELSVEVHNLNIPEDEKQRLDDKFMAIRSDLIDIITNDMI